MSIKKILLYFIIVLLMAFPVSAGEVMLNKWVLYVTIDDDGKIEETIHTEFENTGTTSFDGFSFVVPASKVVISSDDVSSIPSTGIEVKQQTIPGGIKVSIGFSKPVEAGNKWNGRFSFTADKWALKENLDYSVKIIVEAPKAIVMGKEVDFSIPYNPEITSQIFLPKNVNVTSVEIISKIKRSYKKLLQFDHVVITLFQIDIGDQITVRGSFSEVLKQIIDTDEKSREIKAMIKKAKDNGQDITEAEEHLENADEYNNNQALQSFWVNDFEVVKEYVGYANKELILAQKSLSATEETKVIPKETEEMNNTPGFGAGILILMIISSCMVLRINRPKP
jgi:hypothetical protein